VDGRRDAWFVPCDGNGHQDYSDARDNTGSIGPVTNAAATRAEMPRVSATRLPLATAPTSTPHLTTTHHPHTYSGVDKAARIDVRCLSLYYMLFYLLGRRVAFEAGLTLPYRNARDRSQHRAIAPHACLANAGSTACQRGRSRGSGYSPTALTQHCLSPIWWYVTNFHLAAFWLTTT